MTPVAAKPAACVHTPLIDGKGRVWEGKDKEGKGWKRVGNERYGRGERRKGRRVRRRKEKGWGKKAWKGRVVRTRHHTGCIIFYNFIEAKLNGRSLKLRNVCPHPLSNHVWLPPTDSRPRSRAADNTTWPSPLSEHEVNVWQCGS